MLIIKESRKKFVKLLVLFIAISIPWILGMYFVNREKEKAHSMPGAEINFTYDTLSRVDHSQFLILQQEFESPHKLTEACLSCHNKTAHDVMRSSHWKWAREYVTEEGDTIQLGKKNIINNFCIGVASNETRCTSCHIGYGWEDDDFDFNDPLNIDCIVCHDRSGSYDKFPTYAGYPVKEEKVFGGKTYSPPNYKLITENIGRPANKNCGECHFFGGGGNNVKHGDIANELKDVTRTVDVHMGLDGGRLQCVDCHKTERHNISGSLYSIASQDTNRVSCESCHSEKPHANKILNNHGAKVACQTCHIPSFARASSTKMSWDWSTAGRMGPDGKPVKETDSLGNVVYMSQKGSFVWAQDVEPEYMWFNGHADHYVLGDKIDTGSVVCLNKLAGSYSDPGSKIIPVKVHRARQIYDSKNMTMILPHLYGSDSTSYWKNYDWDNAARVGMEAAGLEYSGSYDFIETEMYWPLNHMIAPKEEALSCKDCHSENSRLTGLDDFYLPGRDGPMILDKLGWLMIILAGIGVVIHGVLRAMKLK